MKISLRKSRDSGTVAPTRRRKWKWRTIGIAGAIMAVLLLLFVLFQPRSLPRTGDAAMPDFSVSTSPGAIKGTVALASNAQLSAARQQVAGLERVAATDVLELYVNKSTAEAAVVDLRSAAVWWTNPQDRDLDGMASPLIKGKLGAQLSLTYLMPNGQTKDYDSFNDSVVHKTFTIQSESDGMTVVYEFGNPERGAEAIPLKISKQRLEEIILNKLDQKDWNQMLTRFRLNEDTGIYERREIPKSALKKVLDLIEKAGYTEEDLKSDNEQNGVIEGEGGGSASFTVPLRYKLDGEHLLVSVDASAIKAQPPYRLHTLDVLSYFGAAGKKENGYLFVPDGSGSLIHFNNGKNYAQGLVLPVYGEDPSFFKTEQLNTYETVRMPIYGMKRDMSSFLAVIEDGDAMSTLYADVSGRQHEYNWIGPQFTVLPKDKVMLNAREELIKTPAEPYAGQLQIRYMFQNREEAGYSGMANAYRDYLMRKYQLKPLREQADKAVKPADAPFYVEAIGSISKVKTFLGVSYDSPVPLTTFDEAGQMVEELAARGVSNIQMNYAGWMNGGIQHKLPNNVKAVRELGGRDGLNRLREQLQARGGTLYPEFSLGRVYNDDGWNATKDSVQSLGRISLKFFRFNAANFKKNYEAFSHSLLSPALYPTVMSRYLEHAELPADDGVSIQDSGSEIYSNFNLNEPILRQKSIAFVSKALKQAADRGKVMLQGGNAYVLPYASQIIRAPMQSNRFQITDEMIPFYSMVMHGLIPYAGEAFNGVENQDVNRRMLQAVETGSNVFFSWLAASTEQLRDTMWDDFFAAEYSQWLDEAASAYQQLNELHHKVGDAFMIKHERLADEVVQTTYSNGVRVIVNYGNAPVQVGEVAVEAANYRIEEGSK